MMLYPPLRFKKSVLYFGSLLFHKLPLKKGSISAPAESSGGFAFDLS